METKIYYVKHAQADNPEKIQYGRIPGFNLSEEGKNQAKKIAEGLKKEKISQIFTSPLERCFETANIISEKFPSSPITHSYELVEVDSTEWQGSKIEDLFKLDPYERFINDPEARLPGENLNQLAERMTKFNDLILSNHNGEKIICVSHEFPILALKLSLENKPLKSLKTYNIPTGSLLELTFSEDKKLKSSQIINFV